MNYRTDRQRAGFIKVRCVGWILEAAGAQAQERGMTHYTPRVMMGLVNPQLDGWINAGDDFIYLDHSYYRRGWSHNHFRAVRSACHLSHVVKRPDDRLKKFGVEIEPWRRQRGSKIVIIPPAGMYERIFPRCRGWVEETRQTLAELTDRPVVVKSEKGGLREYLEDAWALVCYMSVAGMEAALMGVPVFSTEKCCSWPISNPLEKIESPEFPDRHDWACGLAYASWHTDEIDEVDWIDYTYSLRDDLPPGGIRVVRASVPVGVD